MKFFYRYTLYSSALYKSSVSVVQFPATFHAFHVPMWRFD